MSGVPKTVQFNMPMGKPNFKLKKTGFKGWGDRVITPLKGPEFPTTAKPAAAAPAAPMRQQKALEAPPNRLALTGQRPRPALTAGPQRLAITGSRPMRQLEAPARKAITAGPTMLALPGPQKALPAGTQKAITASPDRSNGAAWENRLSGQEAAHLERRRANRGRQFPM